MRPNELLVRVTNLEDRFDGEHAKTYFFDINEFAKEFLLEANAHLLPNQAD